MAGIAVATAIEHRPDRLELLRLKLGEDKLRVESLLSRLLDASAIGSVCPVPAAMEYSVLGEAQRIRPILALRVARLLRAETESALRAAAAVEILHSASLVIDDLPCMDNELVRRGRACTHVEFGESTAVLAAFSLVALAARIVLEAPASDSEFARLRRFQLSLLRTLDCASLVGGQSMDLSLTGARREELRSTVNDLKTGPLFQLAMEAGAVSAPGGLPESLARFGKCFGLAFQLTDDYLDGEIHDTEILYHQYDRCREILKPYADNAAPVNELVQYLEERVRAASHRRR